MIIKIITEMLSERRFIFLLRNAKSKKNNLSCVRVKNIKEYLAVKES